MTAIKRAFAPEIVSIPLGQILPTRQLSKEMRTSVKFATILASVRELGIVEPLAVHPSTTPDASGAPCFILLDGHLRIEALRQLGATEVDAAISAAIAEAGAASIRDMGKVMAVLKAKYTGQMDFGAVGPRVKEQLS